MSKIVFMYAGQGSQAEKMGMDIYEEFAEYKTVADSKNISAEYKELMHNGTLEELSKTENTQPCMSVFAAGVTDILKNNGIKPDIALGLSLGEYGALYAAGVFDADTYINLTAFRGREMTKAAKGCNCSMSAVLGLDSESVEEACEESLDAGFITLANYNCPGQYVICGDEEAVVKAEGLLKEKGAKRCIRLNVSGPFHTKYMIPAANALSDKFKEIEFNEPQIPVVLNVTGDYYDGKSTIKDLLQKQVQSSVRFEDSLRRTLEVGADIFIEIGPGKALTGFLKKTAKQLGKDVTIFNIETANDIHKIIEWRNENGN